MNEPPIRLCCFQRHWGAVCADGLVMCCLCFHRYPIEKLATDDTHRHFDVCKYCADQEKETPKQKLSRLNAEQIDQQIMSGVYPPKI